MLTIIGGGMTGLTAAYLASKKGEKVRIIESGNEVGGLLNTFEIGGNRLEKYYHHFFRQDAEFHWLLKELGLTNKIIYKKTTMGVFREGHLYDFNSPKDLFSFKPINLVDIARFGFTSLYLGKVADWRKSENINTLSWFYKWAGKGVTNSLWKPLLDIKFGPYANKVPLSWMIGRLSQRLNSRENGDESLAYVDGSWQVLLEKLKDELKRLNVEIILNETIKEFIVKDNKLVGVKTDKKEYQSQKCLLTIPSIYLDSIKNSPYNKENNTIEYFGAVCTILELNRPFSSIYWMNIADEGFPFGGIIEHTNFIPPSKYNNSHIIYLSRYFANTEDLAKMNEKEITDLMVGALSKINPEFSESWIKNIYVFKTPTAATVCDLNFSKKVPNCKSDLEGLFIANMAHIYPDERSTNNSIRVAAEACKVMGINADEVPYGASLSGKIGFN